MRAVVIGASGHIGNALVRALLDRKDEVTACGRRSSPPANLADLAVRYLPGDFDRPGQLDRWIAGHDLVIDAAAPYPIDAFVLADRNGDPIAQAERRTRRLIDSLFKHNANLAYISSFVTLTHPRSNAQQLQMRTMRLAYPYFEVKEFIEAQIVDAARHGLRAVIVNPTYCLGPWDLRDRQRCMLPALVRGEPVPSIDGTLDIIDVRDVAAGLIAATEAKLYGKPTMLGGHKISTRQLFSRVCEIAGVTRSVFRTPSSLALAGTYLVEVMSRMIGQQAPLPSVALVILATFDFAIGESALLELGITPRPLSETLADAIKWYRQIGYC